jgi:hypothetical protein
MKLTKRTRTEVATYIEDFLLGRGHPFAWDDFISFPLDDPELDNIRLACAQLSMLYPPQKKSSYCSEAGFEVLREMVSSLRK